MENRLQTSFMPKRPIVGGGPAPIRQKSPPSFLMIIGVLIFIFTLGLFGGLWWYEGSLVRSNEAKRLQIENEIRNFEPELTRELTVLKTRIDSGKQLLSNHIAFSSVLGLLETITAKSVRFSEMTFTSSPDAVTRESKMTLALKGESDSYVSVAFQSDLFAKHENIRNPIFSDLNLNEKGFVGFAVKADIVPTSVLYKNTISGSAPVIIEESLTPTGTTTPGGTGATTNQTQP